MYTYLKAEQRGQTQLLQVHALYLITELNLLDEHTKLYFQSRCFATSSLDSCLRRCHHGKGRLLILQTKAD